VSREVLIMDILGIILGWKWKVQRTRRRWDRLREHALEKEGRVRREALKELDLVEEKLRMLEEQSMSRRDRTRIMREVEMELSNINDLLEKGEAWLSAASGSQESRQQDR
jgi:sensor c-di-GMP phosphodiesterase-like protein